MVKLRVMNKSLTIYVFYGYDIIIYVIAIYALVEFRNWIKL